MDDLPFLPVAVGDRARLEPLLVAAAYPLCEYTFATQFCWQACNRTEWAVRDDGWLLFRYVAQDGHDRFLCPVGTGDPGPAVAWCLERLERDGHPGRVTMVPEKVRTLLGDRYWFEPEKDNFDYIYLREDLVTLAGGRYSRKRNHIKHFENACAWTFAPMTPGDVYDCLAFLEGWCLSNDCSGNRHLDFESYAQRTALEHFEALGLTGGILRVDGRIAGLSMGEALGPGTWVVHYEKACRDLNGVYQVLCREFARAVPAEVTHLNREQDMGEPGLRKAKESYFPIWLEPAFSLSRR